MAHSLLSPDDISQDIQSSILLCQLLLLILLHLPSSNTKRPVRLHDPTSDRQHSSIISCPIRLTSTPTTSTQVLQKFPTSCSTTSRFTNLVPSSLILSC